MKLLFFIHSLSSGGAERVTTNLANYWADNGWQISIVTLASKDTDFYELHPSVQRIALGLAADSKNSFIGLVNNYRRISVLRSVLRDVQPDIALSMMSTANVLLAFAAKKVPGVVAVGSERIHPPQCPLGYIWELLRARSYRYLSSVIALTEESASWLKVNTGTRDVAVIPNAVSWPVPASNPIVKPELFLANEKRVLLAVGRLTHQKGFDLLIEAFSEILPKFSNWSLVILGEGPERKTLETQIQSKGLTGLILLPGRVGNIGSWYDRSDLYVLTSRFEGFPNTLSEALAYGLPAVSVDCDTGPRDILRNEVDGLLVAQGNHAALVEALARLMSDDDLRAQFGRHAVDIRERFSIDKISSILETLFTGICKKENV